MRVEWHGQSAFTLEGTEGTVFVDPFGDMAAARQRGLEWNYPPIAVTGADLLLAAGDRRRRGHSRRALNLYTDLLATPGGKRSVLRYFRPARQTPAAARALAWAASSKASGSGSSSGRAP